jgi:hypothetical protein
MAYDDALINRINISINLLTIGWFSGYLTHSGAYARDRDPSAVTGLTYQHATALCSYCRVTASYASVLAKQVFLFYSGAM